MLFSILTGAAVKSSVVLAAAYAAAFVLRKHSAATRHLVWTAAFAAILVLPFLSAALPVLRVPLAAAVMPNLIFHDSATIGVDPGAVPPASHSARTYHEAGWRPDWRIWLTLLWAAGAALTFARIMLAYGAAWRVRRAAIPFTETAASDALTRTLGIRRPVEILETKPGSMPTTFGVRRATILMPADASAWTSERRRSVLLHELAHVRRGDAATHLLARIAVALYWWHPLAWTGWREFLKEGERAADDLVLNAGACASEYAGHLLEVARTMQGPSMMAWAATAVARPSQLEGRLLAILDSGLNRTAPGRGSVLAAAALALAIIVPLAAVHAQEATAQAAPVDVDAAIRVAQSQKNYESLDSAAQAATRLAKYDTAQKLLESALQIRAETSGEQSVAYAIGLVKLGEVQQKRDPKSGGDLYARAARILGDRPEAARALTHLGLAALGNRDFTHAFDYFQHMQQVAPAGAGTALMWMAVVRQREGKADEAERLYQSAIAAQDPHSVDAAVIMQVYATFLNAQGRLDQAHEIDNRALDIRKENGPGEYALPAGVYRMSKALAPPAVIDKVEPQYTEEARAAQLSGTVVLRVVIGTDGATNDVRIVRGLGLGLDENAVEAINQWHFKPASKDGQPVKVAATVEVNFKLM